MKKPKSVRGLMIECNLITFRTKDQKKWDTHIANSKILAEHRKTMFDLGSVSELL